MTTPILTNDHEHADPDTPESREARLWRMLGLVMRKTNMRTVTFSDDEIAYSMPPQEHRDGLGNSRLEIQS